MRALMARLAGMAAIAVARVVTGVRGNWVGCTPSAAQRVYFANHTSHGDFVLIWTVLPPAYRLRTRPVAAADYWRADRLRRFLGTEVFDAVLIDRDAAVRTADPIAAMVEAVDRGASLILFPEGTRNTTEERLLPFKSGLWRLAVERPALEFVPVWIENLNRVMPKGEFLPVPLLCTVTLGVPLTLEPGEERGPFLDRARAALLALSVKEAAR
jgi:1-acyl-sn-glycerol-3-phosphate acyltransferase